MRQLKACTYGQKRTDIYSHVLPTMQREAMDRLHQAFVRQLNDSGTDMHKDDNLLA